MSEKQFQPEQLIGMDEKAGFLLAESCNVSIRIEQKDSNSFCGTCEVDPNRINVQVNQGKITAVRMG